MSNQTIESFIADCNNTITVWMKDYKEKRQAENESFDGLMNSVASAISSYGNLITQLCQANIQLTQRIDQCERNAQNNPNVQQSIQQLSNEIITLKKGNNVNKEEAQKLFNTYQTQATDYQKKMEQSMSLMQSRNNTRRQKKQIANTMVPKTGKPIDLNKGMQMGQTMVMNGNDKPAQPYQKPPNPFATTHQPSPTMNATPQLTGQPQFTIPGQQSPMKPVQLPQMTGTQPPMMNATSQMPGQQSPMKPVQLPQMTGQSSMMNTTPQMTNPQTSPMKPVQLPPMTGTQTPIKPVQLSPMTGQSPFMTSATPQMAGSQTLQMKPIQLTAQQTAPMTPQNPTNTIQQAKPMGQQSPRMTSQYHQYNAGQ